MKYRLIGISLIIGLLFTSISLAQEANNPSLILTGGDNETNLELFVKAVIAQDDDSRVNILVLPFSLPSNSLKISPSEREDLLSKTATLADTIEYACQRNAIASLLCSVNWAPLLGRVDAENPENLKFFSSDLDAIYILEGDPGIGLQVIGETAIQTALNQAFDEDIIIAGSVPGLFSAALFNFELPESIGKSVFDFGMLDLLISPKDQGIDYKLANTIITNQIYEPYQLGAMVHAISMPGAPHTGVGINQQSSLTISSGGLVQMSSGNLPTIFLDSETYHAAQAIQYSGPEEPISLRNVLFHLLLPGDSSFDLNTRQHSIASPPIFIRRNTQPLKLSSGEGSLFLSSDLADTTGQRAALNQFINTAGGQKANLLIIVAGFTDRPKALEMNRTLQQLVKVPTTTIILEDLEESKIQISEEITGIVVSASRSPNINFDVLEALSQSWRAGIPVWLQGAAVQWAGVSMINLQSFSLTGSSPEEQISNPFIMNSQEITPALNWIPVSIENDIWSEARWTAMVSLAVNQPENLVIGLPANTGLVISNFGTHVWGEDALLSLDLSQAEIDMDEIGNYQVANGLIDIFSPTEMLLFNNADINAHPLAADTPAMPVLTDTPTIPPPTLTATPTPTETPTPIPTATLRVKPTATIKPTITPPAIPPPPDPGRMNTMVLITLAIIGVILFGIWLNRRWIVDHNDR